MKRAAMVLLLVVLPMAIASAVEDDECLICHSDGGDEAAPQLDPEAFSKSVHGKTTCAGCHADVEKLFDEHQSKDQDLAGVACGTCHDHEDEQTQYERSVHGQGRLAKGLLVSASCVDCHGNHDIHKKEDPRSTIHPDHVLDTCGHCHVGVKAEILESVHGKALREPGKKNGSDAPVCTNCHSSHAIGRTHDPRFRVELVNECGTCHEKLILSYDETYHGKATLLGEATVAKCSDCHGHHGIKAAEDPGSKVHPSNKLETCRRCHPDAGAKFAAFWAHADHHDKERYPFLYWIWFGMTGLLIGVFSFFGLHTALWLVRALVDRYAPGQGPGRDSLPGHGTASVAPSPRPFRRFERYHRITHAFVIVSFLGLALTGAPLKYPQTDWARAIFSVLGGVHTAGWLHRVFAVVTFGYFFAHVRWLVRAFWSRRREGATRLIFGPDSMVPQPSDARDMIAHMKWFLGLGPKPTWDRWTYWEKFDYWAVFWGVAIIGSSGLVMWFPVFFTRFLPGWVVNLALVIHSDEALLAIGFIFTAHFFNSHLRPGKFPVDPVIFTGSVPEHEFLEERGRLVQRLTAEGRLEELRVDPPDAADLRRARLVGVAAWAFGLGLLALILYGYFKG